MKLKYPVCRDCTEFTDHAPRNGSDEPLGLLSGLLLLLAMVIISIIIADVATGFNLHNLLADAF